MAFADVNDLAAEEPDQEDHSVNEQSSGQQTADITPEQINPKLVLTDSSEVKSAESTTTSTRSTPPGIGSIHSTLVDIFQQLPQRRPLQEHTKRG